MNKKRSFTTLKTPLLNDCTNHLTALLNQPNAKEIAQQKKISASYESPIADIVTFEFVRGYN